jgi:hypothetical protein
MPRSVRVFELDARKRIALGTLARHDLYLAAVDQLGIITLTPAEILPLSTPPVAPRKRARKKAAPAVAETPQEQESP